MPKVLMILNRMIIGGPSHVVGLLVNNLGEDFETRLILGKPETNEKRADSILEHLNTKPIIINEMHREISFWSDWKSYWKIRKIIREFRPDVVHTHTSKPGALGRLAAYHEKVPAIIHTFHGHVFHSYFSSAKSKFYILVERFLARISSHIIVLSRQQYHELVDVYRIVPKHKVSVIPLGLNLDPFFTNQEEKRRKFRLKYKVDDNAIAIGIVGRIVPIKNHRLFMRGLLHLSKHSSVPFKAFLVGDGECRPALEEFCKQHGLGYSTPDQPDFSQPVIFTSWMNEIDEVNAGLDIVCLTSLNEGTPVSIIEAQAAGKPVISTICGGIKDVVLEGETALLCSLDNEAEFSDQLKRLVEDETLRIKLSKKSREFAKANFTKDDMVKKTGRLYNQMLVKKDN